MTASRRGPRSATVLAAVLLVAAASLSAVADARALKQTLIQPAGAAAAGAAAAAAAQVGVADALSPYNPITAGPLPADAVAAGDDDPAAVGVIAPVPGVVVYGGAPTAAVAVVGGGYRPLATPFVGGYGGRYYGGYGRGYGGGGWGRGYGGGGWGRGGGWGGGGWGRRG